MKISNGIILFALVLWMGGAAAAAPLSVSGLVSNPQSLSLSELRAMPSLQVAVTQASGHGPVAIDCKGPGLSAILDKAAPRLESRNNAALGHVVIVTADDGYAVALSFGELNSDYGGAAPILATDCSGKPLDAPRLIIPSDKHAGRAVRGVVTVEVR